jgi:DNA-dependent RNA polymerase auxiliary subunit epsilon
MTESFHVIVVYPALHSTRILLENNNIEFISNVTDKDMEYSIIIPKQMNESKWKTVFNY